MGEIYDDHYTQVWWEHGTGIGGDCGDGPPCEHPAYGGMDAWIFRASESMLVTPKPYKCKFCGVDIGFIKRRAYNWSDGAVHTCLSDARATKEQSA
jgi:hypothetical protein